MLKQVVLLQSANSPSLPAKRYETPNDFKVLILAFIPLPLSVWILYHNFIGIVPTPDHNTSLVHLNMRHL